MNADAEFLEAATRRVYRLMAVIGAVASLLIALLKAPAAGLAFALGATGAYLAFSWLHRAIEGIGPDARPTKKRVFVLAALRYLLLGVAGYVIVKVFGMNALAALGGLFVPVAAVIIEILYELIHGT